MGKWKVADFLEVANRRAKWGEISDLGVLAQHITVMR